MFDLFDHIYVITEILVVTTWFKRGLASSDHFFFIFF